MSNQQWDSAEAIAKYHSGYRGYKRPKVHLSPDYDANMRKDIVCGSKACQRASKAATAAILDGVTSKISGS